MTTTSLSEKQQVFTQNVGKLIYWAYKAGYGLTWGDAYRDPRLAALNAEQRLGIAASLHTLRLAIDFNLFRGDVYLTRTEDYRPLGEYWKTLDLLNRWGGDWKHARKDGNHFSMEHEGIQ